MACCVPAACIGSNTVGGATFRKDAVRPRRLAGRAGASAPPTAALALRGGKGGEVGRLRAREPIDSFLRGLLNTALQTFLLAAFVNSAVFTAAAAGDAVQYGAPLKWIVWAVVCYGGQFFSNAIYLGSNRLQVLRPRTPLSNNWYEKLRKPWFAPPNWCVDWN